MALLQGRWSARGENLAGPVELHVDGRLSRGAATVDVYAGSQRVDAVLWDGDPDLCGALRSVDGAVWSSPPGLSPGSSLVVGGAIESGPVESRLRIAIGLSRPALASIRSRLPPGSRPDDADEAALALALAPHLIARADLPFALSHCARSIGLELAGVRVFDAAPVSVTAADPIGPWVNWAESQVAAPAAWLEWRQACRADATILVEDFGAAAQAIGFCGYAPPRPAASELGRDELAWRRWALVDALAAIDDWTLAHELGHLIGAGHAPSHGSAAALDVMAEQRQPIGPRGVARAWARGWQSPARGWQTVMGGLEPEGLIAYTSLPLWSEAGLDWNGEPTAAVGTGARGAAGVAEDVRLWVESLAAYTAERRGWSQAP